MEENKKTDLTKESNFDLIWTSHFSPVDSFTITKWPGRVEDTSLICNVAVRDTNVSSEATIEGLIPYTYQGIDDQDYFQIYDQEEEEIEDEADKLDKCIAIASGLISGIIDVLFVGEFSLQRAKQYGEKDVENIVKKTAKKFGYKGEDLKGAIAHLEKKFPFAADSRVADFGGAKQHHLRDFSHHFSLFGLLCSILTQFTGKVIGTNTAGMLLIRDVSEEMMIGKNLPEKILFGTVFWFFHMVSDMAGSSFSFGRGTGIPGPIVSVIKLFSAIPLFRETKIGEHEFHVWVSKLFNGTLIKRRNNAGQIVDSVPFDLRTEIGILHEGSKQLIPVLINEAIVRGFYLIRRTHREIVEKDIKSIRDLNKIDTQKILPINNPAIRRMCTLSSGVFCAVDIIDALIRAIIEQNPGTFFLRLNYVGIARFIVAIGAEASAFLKETQEDRKRSSYRRYREEQEIAGLKWFALDADQTQILLSLQKQLCLYDISHTQEKSKREKKEQWLNTWIHGMEQSIGVISEAEDQFILDEAQIYEKLEQIKETS